MQSNSNKVAKYRNDEIDHKVLLISLLRRKFLIIALTSLVTILAIIHSLNIQPTYKSTSFFTHPSKLSLESINKNKYIDETKESVFSIFLNFITSEDFQREFFCNDTLLFDFVYSTNPTSKLDCRDFLETIEISKPPLSANYKKLGFLIELPYSLTIIGASPINISNNINQLVKAANLRTLQQLNNLMILRSKNRLEEISIERELLLVQAERARFSEIDRIKEHDGQMIREIKDEISRARFQAKQKRLDKIVHLTNSINLAKSLGIIENNFNQFNRSKNDSIDSTLIVLDGVNPPEWYLYGEKALIKKFEILESRMSDDPFIPELTALKNQLNKHQNNNLLQTLETRKNDTSFIPKIILLDAEKDKIESAIGNLIDASSMQIKSIAIPSLKPFQPNKRKIVISAFFISFFMSCLLVLIINNMNRVLRNSP